MSKKLKWERPVDGVINSHCGHWVIEPLLDTIDNSGRPHNYSVNYIPGRVSGMAIETLLSLDTKLRKATRGNGVTTQAEAKALAAEIHNWDREVLDKGHHYNDAPLDVIANRIFQAWYSKDHRTWTLKDRKGKEN
tara:strand:- start:1709 stop:2113 length:405 start_codon:yes stop_codon:yes gene_type:complete